jgi:GT2 family glycosyltransferase
LEHQSVEHAVIVVDNGSTDGTPELIRDLFPRVGVMPLRENRGFPIACNHGVEGGTGDIVVLLNNDVDARPDFLETLVAPFADDRIGSAAALLVRPEGGTIDCVGLCADPTLAGFPRLRGQPVEKAAASSPVLAGPCGGGGAYRRAAWEEVGGLDEGVRFYGEDLDLALRVCSAGWDTIAVPTAVAVHHGSATAGNRSSWQRYQGGFARGYFLRRYGVIASREAPRVIATESIVVAGDAVISHDLSALRGRAAGWRAARGAPRRTQPPRTAIDPSIGFVESLRLRRGVYAS